MVATTQWMQRIARAGHREHQHYAHGEERPLPGYLAVMAVYGSLAGGPGALTRLTGRPLPDRIAPTGIALTAVATHKLSRLIAKDAVTSPLRAPFTEYSGPAGPPEVNEEVRGQGARKAVLAARGRPPVWPRCLPPPSSLLRRSFVAPASLVGKTAPRPATSLCCWLRQRTSVRSRTSPGWLIG